jgi:type I restriction enzyme, S subunit
MNADRILEHFHRIGDSPGAISRLRQFALHLAVRGKLLEQKSSDESAAALLGRMKALPRPPRYAKRSPELIVGDCGLSIGDPKTALPPGWMRVPLIEIAALESGHTPSRNRPEWWEGDIPWIGLVDARTHNGRSISETLQHTNAAGIANSAARVLPAGTVCFSRTASVGYVVIMAKPMATSQDFVNWVPTEAVDSKWLQLVFIAERTALDRFSKGAIHQTIYYPAWLSMYISLPPLAEQQRIVAKVDELMALCDRLEATRAGREATRDRLTTASLTRLNAVDPAPATFADHAHFALDNLSSLTTRPEQVAQLRKTILNLAVRGNLVLQDSKEAPAPSFGLAAASGQSDRLDLILPNGWSWARVADVADARLGKMLDKAKNRGRPYRYLRNTNVHWFDIRLDDLKTILLEDDEFNGYQLHPGDVLICEGGHGIGRTAVWGGANTDFVFQKALHRVRPGNRLEGHFFSFCAFVYFHAGIIQTYYTGVGIPHFTGRALEQLVFPLPPLAEQRRVVAKVDELMALCDRLESSLTRGDNARSRLLNALLAEALASPEDATPAEPARVAAFG